MNKTCRRPTAIFGSLSKRRRPALLPRFAGLLFLALLTVATVARAQNADDEYMAIFNVVKKADELTTNGPPGAALAKYTQARGYLLEFQSIYPHWHPDVVTFRLNYVAHKIVDLSDTNSLPAVTNAAPSEAATNAAPGTNGTETATPGSQAKVLDQGTEPRTVLRLHPKPGDKQSMVMTINMTVATRVGGTQAPETKIPPMRMAFETTVNEISEAGDISYDMMIGDADVQDDQGVNPMVAAAVKAILAKLKGLTGSGTMSNRGVNKAMKMNIPGDVDPQTRQTMEQMKEAMSNIASPLPEEGVGVGARWEVARTLLNDGMKMDQTENYQLVSVDGDRVNLTNTVNQSAASQQVQSPLAPGTKVDLNKMTGSGTGSITMDLSKLMPLAGEYDSSTDVSVSANVQGQKQDVDRKQEIAVRIEAK